GGDIFRYQIALAEFDYAQGRVSEGRQSLQDLIKSGSAEQVLIAQVKLAEFHLKSKSLDQANEQIADVLRKDSRNSNGLRLRATLRLERNDVDGAIADVRQALNDQPRSVELMLLLASAYERSGSIELAEKQ